jgi:transcriptional regulator with XRE-family HTH domain
MSHQAKNNVGDHFRTWRERHRLSQLHCALEADISQRHLSFLETGRSRPSRDMVIHLAERLNVPLRERNAALHAAGFAPIYSERDLDDPEMVAPRSAIEMILSGHEPFPAIAIDRHWQVLHANTAAKALLAAASDKTLLLTPPVNVLRLSLHPLGLAPMIDNLAEWRDHLLHRLGRQIAATGDKVLVDLHAELLTYGVSQRRTKDDTISVFVPLRLRTPQGMLSFVSTTTVFGTPRDILLSELAIEAFFPADEQTARRLGGPVGSSGE